MSRDFGKSFFDQFLDDYFAESEEHLTSARTHMLALEHADPADGVAQNVLDELLRNFHSLKGLSAMVGLDEATQLSHRIEDYLRELKEPNAVPSADGLERVMAAINTIEEVLNARRRSEPIPDTSLILVQLDAAIEEARSRPVTEQIQNVRNWRFEFRPSSALAGEGITVSTVRDKLKNIGQIVHAAPKVSASGGVTFEFIVTTSLPASDFESLKAYGIEYSPAPESAITTEQSPDRPAPTVSAPGSFAATNVVRVEMGRLDDLMRIVGELVICRFRFDEFLRSSLSENPELQEINLAMERQLKDLRESVMRARMVPIGQIFERMRFVVKGLQREHGKRVELEIEGHDTEIDKLIVEKMMDPLLHLVRNAVSHGIGAPEDRVASGKSPVGRIGLRAFASGDTVQIEVEDDGRGMDIDRITMRARGAGLLGPEEQVDAKRLLDIISSPGFTTRDKADLASGRGVGMAVVQDVVGELGGSMTVQTTAGKGTRFTIQLPLTLMIADSLLVTVGKQRFAIPQTAVREVIAVETASLKVLENNEIVPFRDGVLPIIRLTKIFGWPASTLDRLHVLIVKNNGSPLGLAVDRITGQREIVVRPITDALLKSPGVIGATELGDGRPVLILDPNSLVKAS